MNWKAILKTIGAACAGVVVNTGAQYIPLLPPKYAIGLAGAVAVAGAYLARSPWGQTANPAQPQPK